jgi:hypothetical protein
MAPDPLDVDSILQHMADALPTHQKDDTTSDFSSSYEAIALFSHACMTAVGFRLLGFGEDKKIGKLESFFNPWPLNAFNTVLIYELLYRTRMPTHCT